MEVIGWAMLLMLFVGMALVLARDMPIMVVAMSFVVAFGVVGWIWVAVNLVFRKG